MKIFDCFMYNNENLILEIRLNSLAKYVDKFIIVESLQNHQGKNKEKYNFQINNFNKFKDKIEYLRIDKFPDNYSDWERENFQRGFITNGLYDAKDNDYVIISDIDEIPKLDDINLNIKKKKKYTAFKQKMIYYKLNLLNVTEAVWFGSKMCKFKDLKSPQWLRDQKVKKYPFYRFDKINWNIIEKGGWHFSNIMTPEQISLKLKSYAHSEFNKPEFTDVEAIKKKLSQKKIYLEEILNLKKLEKCKNYPNIFMKTKKNSQNF